MTTAVQRRRGTNTEHATFTGLDGEITVNTTTYTLHVHDGATVGGIVLAKADGSNIVTSSIDINGGTIDGTVIGGSSAAAGTFTSITGTSANINGTITADGLTVDGSTTLSNNVFFNSTSGAVRWQTDEGVEKINLRLSGDNLKLESGNGLAHALFGYSGDVAFYDATGSDFKFFWDASAESLGIGTSSPVTALDVRGEISVDYNATYGLRFYNQGRNNWSSIGNTDTATGANLVFKSSSGEAMRIDSSGNVGIGTTLCGAPLSFADSAALKIQFNGNAANYYGISKLAASGGGDGDLTFTAGQTAAGNFTFDSGGSERMRIDNAGNVGIGTTSPAGALQVYTATTNGQLFLTSPDTGQAQLSFGGTTDPDGGYIRYSDSSDWMAFATQTTERMRIDSSGNLFVGKTSIGTADGWNLGPGGTGSSYFSITSNECFTWNNTTTGQTTQIDFRTNNIERGSITWTDSVALFNTTSDERLKENIVDTTHTVDINDIHVREFDWIENGEHVRYGFIAQELDTVYPEAVTKFDNRPEKMWSVDYSKLVPLLVKEIQDLKAEVAALKGA